jgi:DNA-directed RNA polymerase specialized sigma24 family protein
LTDEEIDAVVAGYQAGLDLNELSSAFGADRRTLANRLEQRGIVRRSRPLTDNQIQEAITLYGEGWSLARIATHLGVYPESVRYRLTRAGIQLRPRPGSAQGLDGVVAE